MANTAYDHRLAEYPEKKFTLINSSGAARFYDAIGNHGFYIWAKAENFELDFLTRVIY